MDRGAASEQPYNVLYLGPSGGGKSVGASILANKIGYKIVLLNCAVQDYEKLIQTKKEITSATWDSIPLQEQFITYIIEDIASLKPSQRSKVNKLLNYNSRHLNSVSILISHSIHSTGMFGILSFLTDIYLTSDSSNLRTLKFLLKYYSFKNVEGVEDRFSSLNKHHYLHLKPSEKNIEVVDNNLNVFRTDGEQLNRENNPINRELILQYFSSLPNYKKYKSTFEFLMNNIPENYIRSNDLSVSFRTKKGSINSFSLLDYIHYINSPEEPPEQIKQFHRFIAKTVQFPQFLIQNRSLRLKTREENEK